MKTKKEKIFDAIFETIYEGTNITSIRVSDIAKRAGIGKGTVYMYFASKEQMIFESAKYLVASTMNDIIYYDYDDTAGFENIFKGFLAEHLKALKKYSNLFYAATSTDHLPQLTPECREMMIEVISKIRIEYQQTLKKLIDLGAKEKIVTSDPSPFTLLTTGQMLFSASGHFWHKETPVISKDVDEYISMMYDMVVKMLN